MNNLGRLGNLIFCQACNNVMQVVDGDGSLTSMGGAIQIEETEDIPYEISCGRMLSVVCKNDECNSYIANRGIFVDGVQLGKIDAKDPYLYRGLSLCDGRLLARNNRLLGTTANYFETVYPAWIKQNSEQLDEILKTIFQSPTRNIYLKVNFDLDTRTVDKSANGNIWKLDYTFIEYPDDPSTDNYLELSRKASRFRPLFGFFDNAENYINDIGHDSIRISFGSRRRLITLGYLYEKYYKNEFGSIKQMDYLLEFICVLAGFSDKERKRGASVGERDLLDIHHTELKRIEIWYNNMLQNESGMIPNIEDVSSATL